MKIFERCGNSETFLKTKFEILFLILTAQFASKNKYFKTKIYQNMATL